KRVSRRSGAGPGAAAVHSGEEVFDDPPDDLHDGDAPPNTPSTAHTIRLARAARRPIAESRARSTFRLARMIPSANQPSCWDDEFRERCVQKPPARPTVPELPSNAPTGYTDVRGPNISHAPASAAAPATPAETSAQRRRLVMRSLSAAVSLCEID